MQQTVDTASTLDFIGQGRAGQGRAVQTTSNRYLGIVLVVSQDDFRGHINWSPHPSLCTGVHFMLGIAKVSNLQQWALATVPIQQQIFQLEISVGYALHAMSISRHAPGSRLPP